MDETNKFLDNIYVVMVEPKEPGNIGSAVRAMKNMGIKNLRLVNPVEYREVIIQKKMGYRSQEIIEASEEFETLEQALEDISVAFVATAKKGRWKPDFLYPEEAGELVAQNLDGQKVAIIFGREESGITVDEGQLANYYIVVPTAVAYPSLNLSQAVLLVLYEIYRKVSAHKPLTLPKKAEQKHFNRLYDNIWGLMKSMQLREEDKGLFHRSLKRALNRTHWSTSDVAVFDRFCKQVRWYIHNKTKDDYVEYYFKEGQGDYSVRPANDAPKMAETPEELIDVPIENEPTDG